MIFLEFPLPFILDRNRFFFNFNLLQVRYKHQIQLAKYNFVNFYKSKMSIIESNALKKNLVTYTTKHLFKKGFYSFLKINFKRAPISISFLEK